MRGPPVEYLLKSVEQEQPDRTLAKLERILGEDSPRPEIRDLLWQITAAIQPQQDASRLDRIPSRSGDPVHLLELARITHFFAGDKLTYVATAGKNWAVDRSIAELEEKLSPARLVRVHRSTSINLDYVDELYSWFGGRVMLRLKDQKDMKITVSRVRLKELKEWLGL
jgi:two-component system LytT family response regulator